MDLDIRVDNFKDGLKVVEGKIVNAANIADFNDFDKAEKVTEKDFNDFKLNGTSLGVKLPAHSVVMLKLQ